MTKIYDPLQAIDLHFLADGAARTRANWERLSEAQRASGEYIDPSQPVLVRVITREAMDDEEDDEDADWHEELLEIISVGGGDHHCGFTLTARKRA